MNSRLSQQEQLRYAPQMLLPELGESGQLRLKQAQVLIVGMGGLGCPAAMYLAAAGIGRLVMADFDTIERSNLHRQILYQNQQIGSNKAQQAAINLKAMAPDVRYQAVTEKITEENIMSLIKDVDLVLDCTDNLTTRLLINQACVRLQRPLISGAASGFQGQLLMLPMTFNSPCYQCIYHSTPEDQSSCLQDGVVGPLVGVIGSMQALQGIKYLIQISQEAKLHLFDAIHMQWQSLAIEIDPNCAICATKDLRNNHVY
ncbi:HesA/MoeB/ThiF family protein [uncultured Paraglaciecola sp.]|uniref:HesA/MoeB/ThiF family protein n=1 Tax=uncultured Paraglaciecola sp. TaxID=1765024 RepID=UPI0030DCB1A1|tara:strand:- start:40731 stop:41504 length:774 start_codon:yes stop_codon:yes gene_type:complete